jgi:hypothetical protein
MARSIKQYTKQAQLGNKGEAFFESLVSNYCLPHRIVSPKDLGIDFICEWVHGKEPTGILFAVQVKTVTATAKSIGVETRLNGLEKFKFNRTLTIDPETLNYWKRLGLPTYLFAILQKDEDSEFNCFYKRFTTVLTLKKDQKKEPFYKVNNNNNKFIAFFNDNKKKQGFARDLYIDYMRWNYYKGSITYLNPRNIGLNQFSGKGEEVFEDLFEKYKDEICSTYRKTKKYLDKNCT